VDQVHPALMGKKKQHTAANTVSAAPAAAAAAPVANASSSAQAASGSGGKSHARAEQPEDDNVIAADEEGEDIEDALRSGSPTSSFASQYGKRRMSASLRPRPLSRKFSKHTAHAFLPDAAIAAHPLFRLLYFFSRWFFVPLHGLELQGLEQQPRDKAILFFGRHSTHNMDIIALISRCWEVSGRVTRALFHRLLMKMMPLLRYLGGVPGHRSSAVALLQSGFWCGVIPGGADEAMVGHENCYRVHWPAKRRGFARVAMESGALLVPFFTRNAEESRWNPFLEIWHAARGYVLYDWLIAAKIPFISAAVYTVAECVWFSTMYFSVPIPVRCTTIFGSPVPYDPDEPLDDVVARCKDALQKLIDEHQPNARQGRNYTRALGERWEELRKARPGLVRRVESWTPQVVKRWLRRRAAGGKKSK